MNKYQELKQQLEEEKSAMLNRFLEVANVGDYASIGTQLYVIASTWRNELYLAPIFVEFTRSCYSPMPVTLSPEIIPEVTFLGSNYDVSLAISQLAIDRAREDKDMPF